MSPGLIRQQLQIRVGVVMRHQHCVLFPQQVFNPADVLVPLLTGELFNYRLRHLLRRQPEIRGCNGAVHIFGTSAPVIRGTIGGGHINSLLILVDQLPIIKAFRYLPSRSHRQENPAGFGRNPGSAGSPGCRPYVRHPPVSGTCTACRVSPVPGQTGRCA